MKSIEDKFYQWAATHGDDKEDADMCKYGMGMMIDFANHVMKSNDSEVDITKPLELSRLVLDPIDEDGDFFIGNSVVVLDEFYEYMSIEEAKQLINFLTKSINER